MQICHFNLPFKVGQTEAQDGVQLSVFRPNQLYTNTTAPGLAFIDGIYVGQGENLQMNQLIGDPIDTWTFSVIHIQELITSFLEEHGLIGKSDAYIQKYLDDNELTLPGAPRLDLPTVVKGDIIRMTGKFTVDTMIAFMGQGR